VAGNFVKPIPSLFLVPWLPLWLIVKKSKNIFLLEIFGKRKYVRNKVAEKVKGEKEMNAGS